jgi:hypothetical protein
MVYPRIASTDLNNFTGNMKLVAEAPDVAAQRIISVALNWW